MSSLRVPYSADEITAEWLTQALRSTGTIGNKAVKSFVAEALADAILGRTSAALVDHNVTEFLSD